MANGYGGSSSSSSVKRISSTSVSDKIIRSFNIDTSNIKASGESRNFTVNGSNDCVFNLIIVNNHDHYYNFKSKTFSATPSTLQSVSITGSSYGGLIKFPALPDSNTDSYTLYLIADIRNNTRHAPFREVRYEDNTIDFNSSIGSDSAVLIKKIYQHANKTITLTAISPNGLTAFGSVSITNDTITTSGRNSGQKISFTVTAVAATTRNFVLKKQIEENDFITYVERTIGSAAKPISGEDISESTYYRWPIDNIVGLQNGMFAIANNITTGSQISNYTSEVEETFVEKTLTKGLIPLEKTGTKNTRLVDVKAIKATGIATVTNGVLTSQAGEITFNNKQPDALKDDNIKIYGYGPKSIKSLSGYEIKFDNLKAELTKVTTTTTSAVSNSTSVPIAERNGIKNGISTVKGIGIDTSSAIPVVSSGAATVSGAGTIVLSSAQTLENGTTLTFGGASRTVTITGDVQIMETGPENVVIRLDLEKIITAT